VEALTEVIRFVLGYYRKNPEFVTLLNTENLHKGRHISKSLRAREYSSRAVAIIEEILASGSAQGLFRKDLVARDIYLLIASTGYFYTSNRHTLTAFLGEPLESPEAITHWEDFVIETLLRTVRADEATRHPHHPTRTHRNGRNRSRRQVGQGRHQEHRAAALGRHRQAHPRRRHHRGERRPDRRGRQGKGLRPRRRETASTRARPAWRPA
jgi:hypothetical protein